MSEQENNEGQEGNQGGNKPILKLSAGLINLAVFEFKNKGENGEEFVTKSVVLQKRYKDKDGNWQTSKGFNVSDLPVLAQLCDEAAAREIIKVN